MLIFSLFLFPSWSFHFPLWLVHCFWSLGQDVEYCHCQRVLSCTDRRRRQEVRCYVHCWRRDRDPKSHCHGPRRSNCQGMSWHSIITLIIIFFTFFYQLCLLFRFSMRPPPNPRPWRKIGKNRAILLLAQSPSQRPSFSPWTSAKLSLLWMEKSPGSRTPNFDSAVQRAN